MRKKLWMVPGLIICTATAQAGSLNKGAVELAGSAGFNSTSVEGSSLSVFTANVSFGYCFTKNWEFMPMVSLASYSGGGGGSLTQFTGGATAVYNFATASGNTVPYL